MPVRKRLFSNDLCFSPGTDRNKHPAGVAERPAVCASRISQSSMSPCQSRPFPVPLRAVARTYPAAAISRASRRIVRKLGISHMTDVTSTPIRCSISTRAPPSNAAANDVGVIKP